MGQQCPLADSTLSGKLGARGTSMRGLLYLRPAVAAAAIGACVPLMARADVLPPPGDEAKWAVLSLEGVVSLERPLGTQKSLSLWGGVGTVWTSADAERSWGGEIAAEARVYARGDCFGSNAGVYLGVALFDSEEEGRHVAITPGVKVTFSIPTRARPVLVEPYLGLSYPLIKEVDGGEWAFPDVPYMTLGFRLVLRYLRA